MKINLLPFVVEALGINKKICKDIDEIYKENRYEYYKQAKEHELYNHPIVTGGSLLQEEYCKKVLGLLSYKKDNEKTLFNLDKLFRKGFRYAYTYIENHSKINLANFVHSFLKKHGGNIDNSNINLEYYLIILLFLTLNSKKELVQDDLLNRYMQTLNFRWEHYEDIGNTRIDINKANEIDREKVKVLKQAIYKKYNPIRNFNDLSDNRLHDRKMEQAALLFDYENLDCLSLFENINFTNRDIDEIIYLFVISDERLKLFKPLEFQNTEDCMTNDVVDDATKFLVAHLYLRYMIKAYKQVKEMYFENNKETMFVELEGLEKLLHNTEQKLLEKEKNLSNLQGSYETLEKENRRLKLELQKEEKNKNELNGLREFLFNLDNEKSYKEEKNNPDELKDVKAAIVGGHDKWQHRMKELLPNFIFIHPDNMSFDINLLNDIDFVFIYPNYLNHGIYYKVMSVVNKKDTKISYINQQNEDLVLQTFYNTINN